MTDYKYPPVEDRGDMVILRGELGSSVAFNVMDSDDPGYDEFLEKFELDDEDYLADPEDTFYQVIQFTRIIKRKSDGKLFGMSHYDSPGNDSMEGDINPPEPEDFGIKYEYDEGFNVIGGFPHIFLPVKEFTRIGYEVVMPG